MRRLWGIEATVKAEPLGLLGAVAGVAVGRFLALSPGLFLGLVVGVDAGESPTPAQRGRAALTRGSVVLGLAVGAWGLYSAFFGGGEAEEGAGGWLAGFFSDGLSAITIEGMTYLVTGLLPLPLLPGRELFVHSKRAWAAIYVVVALAFAVVALPTILGEEEHSAAVVLRQAAVMLAFTAVSLGSWLRARRRAAAPEETASVA